MDKIIVTQGTNNAWFIYLNNKVICGSHSQEWINIFKKAVEKHISCNHEDCEQISIGRFKCKQCGYEYSR